VEDDSLSHRTTLAEQVPGTVVESILAHGVPLFLTLGKKQDDGAKIIVTWFAFAVRAELHVRAGGEPHRLDSAITCVFVCINEPDSVSQFHLDLHADADAHFTSDALQERLLSLRATRP
jgi:hypothetical protein